MIKTCLIVDDDQDDQEIFLMTVAKINKDIKCFTSNNGIEALILLQSKQFIPDYIFLDVNMPKMSGIECLKAIKNLPHLNSSKVFMYSTALESTTLKQSKELGALDFIIKPASLSALKETLSAVLEKYSK
jgi:response regulator of citrate/malate metabolism